MRATTIAGANLFRLAAEQLGDATQWIRIAQLNGQSDFLINGLATLRLPDTDSNSGGGTVVQQSS